MGLFTKDIKTMDDLFTHVLQDVYYAEQQILKTFTMRERLWIASSLRYAEQLIRRNGAMGKAPGTSHP